MDPPLQPEQPGSGVDHDLSGQQAAASPTIEAFFAQMDRESGIWTDPPWLANAVLRVLGGQPPDVVAKCLWVAVARTKMSPSYLILTLFDLMSEPVGLPIAGEVLVMALKDGNIDVATNILRGMVHQDPYYAGRLFAAQFVTQFQETGAAKVALDLLSTLNDDAVVNMLTAMLAHKESDIAMLMIGVRIVRPTAFQKFLGTLDGGHVIPMITLLAERLDPANPHPLLSMIREFLARLNCQQLGYVLNKLTRNNLPVAVALLSAMAPHAAGEFFACMLHYGSDTLNAPVQLLKSLWAQDHVLAGICFVSAAEMKADSPASVELCCELLELEYVDMVVGFLAVSDPAVVAELVLGAVDESLDIMDVLVRLIGQNDTGVSLALRMLRYGYPSYTAQLEANHPEFSDL